ncbi:MAG: hypothetical protein QM723_29450 [Myxococcaceae bacterium]
MSGWMPFFLLWTLAVVDGGFAGFRSAAGRDGHIFKEAYFRSAIRRGLRYGFLVTVLAGLLIGVAAFASPSPQARVDELQPGAQVMLWVLGGYATLVLLALGIWSTAEADLRTLASVIILGPFTLIRPLVIVGAAGWAAYVAPNVVAAGLAVAVCVLQLSVEPLLNRATAKK